MSKDAVRHDGGGTGAWQWAAAWAGLLLIAIGCYHDKYRMRPPEIEEYRLPPREKRFDEPETAIYRPPSPPKEEKSLLGRPPAARTPVGLGAIGP